MPPFIPAGARLILRQLLPHLGRLAVQADNLAANAQAEKLLDVLDRLDEVIRQIRKAVVTPPIADHVARAQAAVAAAASRR